MRMSFSNQGIPNVGSNANAGTLDFLRNNQQVEGILLFH